MFNGRPYSAASEVSSACSTGLGIFLFQSDNFVTGFSRSHALLTTLIIALYPLYPLVRLRGHHLLMVILSKDFVNDNINTTTNIYCIIHFHSGHKQFSGPQSLLLVNLHLDQKLCFRETGRVTTASYYP